MPTHLSRETWAELCSAEPAVVARRLAALSATERREAEELLRLASRLQAALRPVEPDAAFVRRLGAGLRASPRTAPAPASWWHARSHRLAIAATVAGVVAVAWMRRRRQPELVPHLAVVPLPARRSNRVVRRARELIGWPES